MRRCASCGDRASFELREPSNKTALCRRCLDRALPELQFGALCEALERSQKRRPVCPHCGWTSALAEQNGLVGCPMCYATLASESVRLAASDEPERAAK